MNLSIISPRGTLFNGCVSNIMLPGELGPFQVFANHAPTLSSLIEGDVIYATSGKCSSISVKSGFASIAGNQIIVLCEPIQ